MALCSLPLGYGTVSNSLYDFITRDLYNPMQKDQWFYSNMEPEDDPVKVFKDTVYIKVPGFVSEDLDINYNEKTRCVTVKGKHKFEYGITEVEKQFHLNNGFEIQNAVVKDGMLYLNLAKIEKKELELKKITVS